MNAGNGDGDEALIARCHDFVVDAVRPVVEAARSRPWQLPWDAATTDQLMLAADEAELRGIGGPKRHDADGFDALTMTRCVETLAQGDIGVARRLATNWLLSDLLASTSVTASGSYLRRYLDDPAYTITTGADDLAFAVAFGLGLEIPPDDGAYRYPVLRTAADGRRVDGRAPRVPAAQDATLFVLFATSAASLAEGEQTGAIVLVGAGHSGVDVSSVGPHRGQWLVAPGDVTLRDVAVGEGDLVGTGGAVEQLLRCLRRWMLVDAACSIGVAGAALDAATRQVKERVQGERQIIRHQGIARITARMIMALESARALTHRAARMVDSSPSEAAELLVLAKLHAAECAQQVALGAMDVHGGSGVMGHVGVERHLRDADSLLYTDGGSDEHLFAVVRGRFGLEAGVYDEPWNARQALLVATLEAREDERRRP